MRASAPSITPASEALRAAQAIRNLVSEMEWPDGIDISVSIAVLKTVFRLETN